MTVKQLLKKKNSVKDAKQAKKGGFTLIEVMITILLLTVVLSAILSCFVQGFEILMRMKQMTAATQGIQNELELIRNMRYSDILSMDNSFTNDSFSYLDNSSGIISLEDSVGAEIKKLTVSVTWTYRGRQMRKEVKALLERLGYERSETGNVAILDDDFPGLDRDLVRPLSDALKREGITVSLLDGRAVANPFVVTPSRFDLLVLVNPRSFPAEAMESIIQFTEKGGDLIVLGGPSFRQLLWQFQGKWLTQDEEHPFLSIAGIGGMGKSTLTWRWLNDDVLGDSYQFDGVVWWSFYDEKSGFEKFLDYCLKEIIKIAKARLKNKFLIK